MKHLWNGLRLVWLNMLEPPWRHSEQADSQTIYWLRWLVGWSWTLAGLVLGALAAPSLIQVVGLADTSYSDWLVIAVAVAAGVLVQTLGWVLLLLFGTATPEADYWDNTRPLLQTLLFLFVILVLILWPLAGVGYGIYRYLTWIGAGQREVTIAFVGGLLIKMFAIPLVKGIVTGALLRWVMNWLRGGKNTKNAA